MKCIYSPFSLVHTSFPLATLISLSESSKLYNVPSYALLLPTTPFLMNIPYAKHVSSCTFLHTWTVLLVRIDEVTRVSSQALLFPCTPFLVRIPQALDIFCTISLEHVSSQHFLILHEFFSGACLLTQFLNLYMFVFYANFYKIQLSILWIPYHLIKIILHSSCPL